MKKILAVLIVAIALLVLAAPAFATPPETVTVCHITDFDTLQPDNPYSMVVGRWKDVNPTALSGHQSHGDFLFVEGNHNDIDFGPVIFGLTWRQIATNLGLDLDNVDCAGFVLDF